MKTLVFDTGPIISLVTDNLLWILNELKKKFQVDFIISSSVRKELVDNALNTKKFAFEGILINSFIEKNTLSLYKEKLNINFLENCVNNIFFASNNPIQLLQEGEMESLLLSKKINADALVVDERTTRLLIEDPEKLKKLLENKLHCKIRVNNQNLKQFHDIVGNIKIIRSSELLFIAYESHLFDKIKNRFTEKDLLNGLLWGTKLRGCSISEEEINKVVNAYV